MAQDPHFIDVDKVERELVSALEADRKYSRENDAKFRAVHQKVATYEEFREIVKGSHLTSLDRDDITGRKGRKQPWNTVATAATSSEYTTTAISGNHGNEAACPPPLHLNNVQDFLREWKRLKGSPKQQYQFLLQIGGPSYSRLFKVEISMGLLGEIVEVFNLCLDESGECSAVLEILMELSKSSRFRLALSFLERDEKKAVQDLFQKLDALVSKEVNNERTTCLHQLSKLYSVNT